MSATHPWPVIPEAEYPARWKRVQELMQRLELDLLLAYGDDRAVFGPAHLRWLANVPVHFEPMFVLIPPQGEPVLLTGPESDVYARRAGRVPQVHVLQEFTHPDEDYPYSTIKGLREVLSGLSLQAEKVRRVGLGGLSLIGASTLQALQSALPSAHWLDVETQLCQLRAVKSPAELEVIRFAYRIAEVGLEAAVQTIQAGVTERAVAAEVEAAMRRAGAEGTGIDTIVASGPNTQPILGRSTFRKIEPQDRVLLTIAPRYEGYHAAIGRLVFVGQPPAEVERAYQVAVRAQEACGEALRPGVEGRQVEAIGRRIVGEAGFGQYFLYSGLHSVGVIEFEPPIFGPSVQTIIEENMVISVDIPMFNAPWGGLRVEDGYLITAGGAEKLEGAPFRFEIFDF